MFRGLTSWWDTAENTEGESATVQTTADKVGGYDATQSNSLRRPSVKTINGKKALAFDQVNDDYYQHDAAPFESASELTLFVVAARVGSGRIYWFGHHDASDNERQLLFYLDTDDDLLGEMGGTSSNNFVISTDTIATPTNLHVYGFRAKAGEPMEIWVNGVEVSGYSAQPNAIAMIATFAHDVAWNTISLHSTPGVVVACDYGDRMVYRRKLTDHEMLWVSRHLMEKWGIS